MVYDKLHVWCPKWDFHVKERNVPGTRSPSSCERWPRSANKYGHGISVADISCKGKVVLTEWPGGHSENFLMRVCRWCFQNQSRKHEVIRRKHIIHSTGFGAQDIFVTFVANTINLRLFILEKYRNIETIYFCLSVSIGRVNNTRILSCLGMPQPIWVNLHLWLTVTHAYCGV